MKKIWRQFRAAHTFLIVVTALAAILVVPAMGRDGGRGGGGGRVSAGGGGGRASRAGSSSFSAASRSSNFSRASSSSRNYSRAERSLERPSMSRSNSSISRNGGLVPSNNGSLRTSQSRPKSSGERLGSASAQLPSAQRPRTSDANRTASNRKGVSTQPSRTGTKTSASSREALTNRPSSRDVGNFLNLDTNASGKRLANAKPGQQPGITQRPGSLQRQGLSERTGTNKRQQFAALGQNRPNWSEWSQNRSENWQQAINNRQNSWNEWSSKRQENLKDFQQNRDDRWNQIQAGREDRQAWRDQNREDFQNYRKEMWDYRYDRAEEIWDDVKDYRDDLFDDHWWGRWYPGYVGAVPANPWWWWAPAAVGAVTGFVAGTAAAQPYYYDYGVTTVYQGDTVFVNGKPAGSIEDYSKEAFALADKSTKPSAPPAPQTKEGTTEWLPMGVWALTQEEKGDAFMFFQISVNKKGVISGAFANTLTGENQPIVGAVDHESQRAAWRIGENGQTAIETGIFNLTKDVAPVTVYFGPDNAQTWLMVRLPQPSLPDQPTKVQAIDRTLPPLLAAAPKEADSASPTPGSAQ